MYVNVAEVFAGGAVAPEPNILPFVEDSYLFYAGEFNLVFGDTESGKTWLCLSAVAATVEGGGRAVVVDLDHNGARSILNRLEMLGVDRKSLVDRQCFRLAEPESDIELKELVADLAVFKPDVVVLDSLGEVMPLFRANSNSADDFTVVHTDVIKPLKQAGAAVLVVDHLPKSAESRQHGPTGTAAKTRAVGGTAVRVSAEKAFRPGDGGRAKLELYKDRHGGVRRQVPGSDNRPVIGTFTLVENEGRLTYSFQSALTVPASKQAEIDSEQVSDDVARLRELYRQGVQVGNIREVKIALNCGQQRAKRALDAFQAELGSRAESAA
ncbi:bifunctional DNA primase/polymerase famiily protein [Mycobacteroides abscessus subsp. abscessus]|nr:bifunctional DNA primase/polymerase famiily protein [Mycobacteroides abscessus subsp. abscessus]